MSLHVLRPAHCVPGVGGLSSAKEVDNASAKLGKMASVVGYPHRTNPDEMRAERITIDGQIFKPVDSWRCRLFLGRLTAHVVKHGAAMRLKAAVCAGVNR